MHLIPPPPTTQSFVKSAIPLLLTLSTSRCYLTCLLLLHLLALTAIYLAAIPILIKVLIAAAVMTSLVINMRDVFEKKQLVWRAGNNWVIGLDHTEYRPARLTAIDFLSRWLVIISLKEENSRVKKFIIPFDAVNTDSFRLLRVRLRIEGHELLNPDEEG